MTRRPTPAMLLVVILAVAACGGSTGADSPTGSVEGSSAASVAPGAAAPSGDAASCATPAPLGSTTDGSACTVPMPPSSAGGSAPAATDAAATSCGPPAPITPSQTEGPYFKAGSPERTSLVEPGMTGTPLTLTGLVVTTGCAPIAGATVDVWQSDATGAYDNAGYRLRGHVPTDSAGRYTIGTIVPGEYPGRTEHIHVKVTPPGGSTLTTQLYFPGVAANDSDGIYSPELLLDVAAEGDGFVGTFTFVLGG